MVDAASSSSSQQRRRMMHTMLALVAVAALSAVVAPATAAAFTAVPTNTLGHRTAAAASLLPTTRSSSNNNLLAKTTTADDENGGDGSDVVESFVKTEFSAFHSLLSANPGLWSTIASAATISGGGVTLFCPSNAAFDALGAKQLSQLRDERNQEIMIKMGLYHVVLTDAISAARLRTEDWTQPAPRDGSPRPITVSGLVTEGGTVPVGRRPTAVAGSKNNTNRGGTFWKALLGQDEKPLANDQSSDDSISSTKKSEKDDVVIGPAARIVKSYKLAGGAVLVHEMDSLISPDLLWRYCDQLRIPGF